VKLKSAGLTILGTDTEVGKTYVACRIIESLFRDGVSVRAYKPVASGAPSLEESDGYKLWDASGRSGELDQVNPQSFLAPLAPPVAAELEGKQVSDSLIIEGAHYLIGQSNLLVLEGAGGLFSPISWSMTNADLALEMQFPVVLVSKNRLGMVNQVLTTLVAARSIGLHVCCIVLNNVDKAQFDPTNSNVRMVRKFLANDFHPPFITELAHRSVDFRPVPNWHALASKQT